MIAVVGAVAIDMVAMRERFLEGTSNPSDIRFGLGGVGYRVFSNLECPRRFVTALAVDPISRWAREILQDDGDVAIEEAKGRDAGPPLYLALMESGSLKVAASDFRIVEESLSFTFVERHVGSLGPADFLVLDANLAPVLMAGLLRRYAEQTRVVFEPVSVEKARRHAAALGGLFLMTPTAEEMHAIRAGDIHAFMSERRIGAVLVTRGAEGASLYHAGRQDDFLPESVVDTPDTTGSGDLLLAFLLTRLHQGDSLREAVRSAMRRVEERLREASA